MSLLDASRAGFVPPGTLEVKNPRAAGPSQRYRMSPVPSLLAKADGWHHCVLFLQLGKQLELLVLLLRRRDSPGSAWGGRHATLSCLPLCLLPRSAIPAANGYIGQS